MLQHEPPCKTNLHRHAPGLDVESCGHSVLTVEAVCKGKALCMVPGMCSIRWLGMRRRGRSPCEHLCALDGISIQEEPGVNVPSCLFLLGLHEKHFVTGQWDLTLGTGVLCSQVRPDQQDMIRTQVSSIKIPSGCACFNE